MKNRIVNGYLIFFMIVIGISNSAMVVGGDLLSTGDSVANEQDIAIISLIFPKLQKQVREKKEEQDSLRTLVGIRRDTATVLSHNPLPLQLSTAADGSKSLTITIVSPEAKAIRIGLRITTLPDSAILEFRSSTSSYEISGTEINTLINENIAANTNGSNAQVYWSPTLTGESCILQITIPPGVAPSTVDVTIPAISHFTINPLESIPAEDSCYVDVSCNSDWDKMSRATAKMIFTQSGYSYTCTGTLLDDTDTDTTPYFISANHCIPSQTVASTLQTVWFYESSQCYSTTVNPSSVTLTGGATLLWGEGMSAQNNDENMDISFMLLKKTPPDNAVYANWNNSTAIAGIYSTVHHPGGGLKKMSRGALQSTYDCWMSSTSTFNCTPSSNGNFVRLNWSTAGAETGSHGAGLFQTDDRLAATLVGGSGNPCYADFGYFSLFKNAFKEGNLGKWLTPTPGPGPEPEQVIVAPLNYLLLKN